MIKRICFLILFLLPALPLYAGHGTIRETDTQIYVEYYGDDNEIQAGRALKKEEEEKKASEAKAKEMTQQRIEDRGKRRAADRAERRDDD